MYFLSIHSGHQVRWKCHPGSHRRKVTQEEDHTGGRSHRKKVTRDFSSTFFLRCVPLFFSREGFSHSFLSLVDREVEICVLTILIVLHPLGIFSFSFSFFSEKNPVCRHRTHIPTCQKVTWLPLSYRGDRRRFGLLHGITKGERESTKSCMLLSYILNGEMTSFYRSFFHSITARALISYGKFATLDVFFKLFPPLHYLGPF